MSELRSCRSQPVEELRTPFKHQHKACCPCESAKPFPGATSARESPRDRAKVLHFSWCHALKLCQISRELAPAQQVTCTRGAVGESTKSGHAYIALCPNVVCFVDRRGAKPQVRLQRALWRFRRRSQNKRKRIFFTSDTMAVAFVRISRRQ